MSSPGSPRSIKPRKPAAAQAGKRARTPGGKRLRTRQKLLDSAAELFLAKGLFAVSLDDVAAHAGLTKGAIYGNFKDKDDLIYAVAMERLTRPRPVFVPDVPLRQQLREMARQAFSAAPAARRRLAFLTQLDLYTLTHERFAERLEQTARERYFKSAESLSLAPKENPLPLPAVQYAVVIHALFNGLLYQRGVLPDIVTEEVVIKALEALID